MSGTPWKEPLNLPPKDSPTCLLESEAAPTPVPSGPQRFDLYWAEDGATIELRPCLSDLSEVPSSASLSRSAGDQARENRSTSVSLNLSVPPPPVAERQTSAEIDAYEAAFFEEYDSAIDRADRHDPLLAAGVGKKGKGSRVAATRGRREFMHGFQPPPRLPAPPSRWELVLAKLLWREGHWINKGGNAALPGRSLSLREVKRWEQRHGAAEDWRPATPWEMRKQGVLLRQEARARGPPVRVSLISERRRTLTTKVARSTGHKQLGDARSAHPAIGSSSQNQLMAMSLGLDEATYLMIKSLENREIRPEDYELLGRLDEKIKPKTLEAKQLSVFPTEIFSLPRPPVGNSTLPDRESEVSIAFEFGIGFWKLPFRLDEDEDLPDVADAQPEAPLVMDVEACGICLLDFEEGDELRRLLPCCHRFHKDCIDRWLLEASTTCPIDKGELSVGSL